MRSRLHDERGSALIIILAVTGILSLLVTVSFTTAQRSIQVADAEEETHGALAAAEAGIDDYLFRLNNVDQYWAYGPTNLPPDGNRAFVEYVPMSGGQTDTNVEGIGEYTYDVDTSQLTSNGVLQVTSFGCAPGPCDRDVDNPNGRVRVVQATLRQQSFVDYLYFTDYETQPPLTYTDVAWAEANCPKHKWDPGGRPSECVDIFWGGNDRLHGPFHTNDRFQLNGNAIWYGAASSSDPHAPGGPSAGPGLYPYDAFNGAVPTFVEGLRYQPELQLPPSNSQIRAYADPALGGEGCMFTGPTEIVLRNNGTMDVRSPQTRQSNCGTWPTLAGVRTTASQNMPIPANGVIYVQAQPSTTTDPNHRADGCGGGVGNRLGYPIPGDMTSYSCSDGDVFVEGTLNGRLTIASENDVVITWHLRYAANTDSMLGLIPNDFAWVYHPVGPQTCTVYNGVTYCYAPNMNAAPRHPTAKFRNAEINAAILAVNGSFLVQQWGQGRPYYGQCDNLGDLYINGAIAQVFRGPVGTGSGTGGVCTGYDKDYNYDQRLRFSNPPAFINPVEASWSISRFAEQ